MQHKGLGKADRLAHQPFDPRPSREMLTLDLLRVARAGAVDFMGEVPSVGTPRVCVIARDAEGLEQRLQLQKHLVFPSTKDVG